MGEAGLEIELAAEEEDADAVVGEGMEPARRRLDALDLAVEAFAHRVGDRMPPPGHHPAESLLEHPRDFLHRFELAVDRKRQAERRSAAYCDPFCFAHAAGVISAI